MGFFPQQTHAQINLGDIRLDVVSDGALTLPASFIFEPMPQDELAPILAKYNLSPDVLTPPCNVTLMRHGDKTVLFDVGAGPDFTANAGKLLTSLETLGVAPEDVTDVVFTHAHPDHLWGVLDDFGDPLFTQANYVMGKSEWEYWMNPNTVNDIDPARTAHAVGAQRRLAMIEGSVRLVTDGEEIMPNVAARASYGHTPGHMSFEVRGGSESVMILGDCIGNHHVAFEHPEWSSGSDQDGEAAIQTRLSLLDQLATEQTRIIGFHLAGDGTGYVEKTAKGYRFVKDS